MSKETESEDKIPEKYRWDRLVEKRGVKLKKFYKELLNYLGDEYQDRIKKIYQGAISNIDKPKNLEKIVT